jgi:Macrocin-O-methyltransferase (TylF)
VRSALRIAKRAVQVALTSVGAHCSPLFVHRLDAVVGYLEVGRWMHERGFPIPHRYPTNQQVWEAVAPELRDEKVLYMEFGVWKGESIRAWAKLLRHPDSMLHGFDSFEGLPTNFTPAMRAGHFSTGGQLPVVDDPRVSFFKGWFDDTLPRYKWPSEYDRLVVNIDADLYTSTAYVLDFVADRIVAGTLIYFDEFNDHDHELRAFSDFLDKTGMTFRVRAARSELGSIIFERTADRPVG